MNITHPNLVTLKLCADTIRNLESPHTPMLSDQLLKQLVAYVVTMRRYYSNDNYSGLFEHVGFHACGCMGPQNGNPFCGCEMAQLVYDYRYDIAIVLQISNRLVVLKKKVLDNINDNIDVIDEQLAFVNSLMYQLDKFVPVICPVNPIFDDAQQHIIKARKLLQESTTKLTDLQATYTNAEYFNILKGYT